MGDWRRPRLGNGHGTVYVLLSCYWYQSYYEMAIALDRIL
jgi:hypothetical protein